MSEKSRKKTIGDELQNAYENTDKSNDEIEKLRAEAAQNLEGWKRAQADFQNLKKRVENERAETAAYFKAEVIKSFLPVVENFERALENVSEDVAQSLWFSGFKMLQGSLEKALKDNSVEWYGMVGDDFDPNIHQALAQQKGPAGKITQVLAKGYKMGDRIVKEAAVIVGQGS